MENAKILSDGITREVENRFGTYLRHCASLFQGDSCPDCGHTGFIALHAEDGMDRVAVLVDLALEEEIEHETHEVPQEAEDAYENYLNTVVKPGEKIPASVEEVIQQEQSVLVDETAAEIDRQLVLKTEPKEPSKRSYNKRK